MDTTYFKCDSVMMVFHDYYESRNLYCCYVSTETVSKYQEGINVLIDRGWFKDFGIKYSSVVFLLKMCVDRPVEADFIVSEQKAYYFVSNKSVKKLVY